MSSWASRGSRRILALYRLQMWTQCVDSSTRHPPRSEWQTRWRFSSLSWTIIYVGITICLREKPAFQSGKRAFMMGLVQLGSLEVLGQSAFRRSAGLEVPVCHHVGTNRYGSFAKSIPSYLYIMRNAFYKKRHRYFIILDYSKIYNVYLFHHILQQLANHFHYQAFTILTICRRGPALHDLLILTYPISWYESRFYHDQS